MPFFKVLKQVKHFELSRRQGNKDEMSARARVYEW